MALEHLANMVFDDSSPPAHLSATLNTFVRCALRSAVESNAAAGVFGTPKQLAKNKSAMASDRTVLYRHSTQVDVNG